MTQLIGTKANQVPVHGMLGDLAYTDRAQMLQPEPFWELGDGSETTFQVAKNYKPVQVFNAGLLVKDGDTDEYTVTYDEGYYYVVFAVAPSSSNDICIMATRVK